MAVLSLSVVRASMLVITGSVVDGETLLRNLLLFEIFLPLRTFSFISLLSLARGVLVDSNGRAENEFDFVIEPS